MSCKCCCTHGHTAIQEKRNSLLKDYWRIILSALLLFGGLILNATDTTFFKESMYLLYGTCLPISP